MWARNVEFMFGIWLALSPFIFQDADPPAAVYYADFAGAALVCGIAVAAYNRATRKLHLVNGVVGLSLVVYAFLGPLPPPPYHQNHVVLGLLLMMTCIIPNRASEPPVSWKKFYDDAV